MSRLDIPDLDLRGEMFNDCPDGRDGFCVKTEHLAQLPADLQRQCPAHRGRPSAAEPVNPEYTAFLEAFRCPDVTGMTAPCTTTSSGLSIRLPGPARVFAPCPQAAQVECGPWRSRQERAGRERRQ